MKKNSIFVGLVILLVGFGMMVYTPSVAAPAKTKIRFASLPLTMGGSAGVIALADLLNRKTDLDITVEATAGTDAVPLVMKEGAQLGGATILRSPTHAFFGYDKFKKGGPNPFMRILIELTPVYNGTMTGPKTGIKTFADMKGKRLTYDAAGMNISVDYFLTLYGIDPNKDVKKVLCSGKGAAVTELQEGRADAALNCVLGGSKILELRDQVGEVIVVPIERDKLMVARQKWPEEFSVEFPGMLQPGSVLGIDNKVPIPTTVTYYTISARADLPDEIAYKIVKTMFDNVQTVSDMSPDFKGWKPEYAVGAIPIPFHPGSVRAFKEKGIWTPDMEKEQQRLLGEAARLKPTTK